MVITSLIKYVAEKESVSHIVLKVTETKLSTSNSLLKFAIYVDRFDIKKSTTQGISRPVTNTAETNKEDSKIKRQN